MTSRKINGVPQLSVIKKKLYADSLKSILYLYGQHDAGKSTTLGWLIFYLTYDNSNETLIDEQFNYWKNKLKKGNKKKNSFPDVRVIVPYKGKYVYIALHGDSLEATEANVFFFEGRLLYNNIYIFEHGLGLRKLNDSEKDYYETYTPAVCISASFYDRLVEEPLCYFAEKKHFSTCMASWLHLPKTAENGEEQVKKKCKDYAKLLKKLIDESLTLIFV